MAEQLETRRQELAEERMRVRHDAVRRRARRHARSVRALLPHRRERGRGDRRARRAIVEGRRPGTRRRSRRGRRPGARDSARERWSRSPRARPGGPGPARTRATSPRGWEARRPSPRERASAPPRRTAGRHRRAHGPGQPASVRGSARRRDQPAPSGSAERPHSSSPTSTTSSRSTTVTDTRPGTVLRRFADVLRETVRDVDVPARYGGEELPCCYRRPTWRARSARRALRQAVAERPLTTALARSSPARPVSGSRRSRIRRRRPPLPRPTRRSRQGRGKESGCLRRGGRCRPGLPVSAAGGVLSTATGAWSRMPRWPSQARRCE